MLGFLRDPAVRSWLYRIALAALLVLTAYGILTPQRQYVFAVLFAALFGVADANVPRQDGTEDRTPGRQA